ncbi:hypothetical protein RIF29_14698 [Crotalaria pallida]|uniref:Uncharacterized protein n=1 Tax=Crotalaria pallida TaxID=3830 RepID=A0AAN9III6_CROPI
MYPVKKTFWFDIYKNIDKIPLVKCPVVVIHSTNSKEQKMKLLMSLMDTSTNYIYFLCFCSSCYCLWCTAEKRHRLV